MRGKKAKMIHKLVTELASPGVDKQAMVGTMKKTYGELTHKQKKTSKLFSDHTV